MCLPPWPRKRPAVPTMVCTEVAILTADLGVGAGGGLELLRLRLARRAAELLPDVDEDARVPVLELHERGLYADVRRLALLEELGLGLGVGLG